MATGFITYGGGVVVTPLSQISRAFIIRNDVNNIAILDTVTAGPVDFAIEHFHSFTGSAQDRNLRKKIVRFEVTGKGVIQPGSYLIIAGDEQRSDVYIYSMQSPVQQAGLLWKQQTMGLVARQFDVALFMMGTGIEYPEVRLEYLPVG